MKTALSVLDVAAAAALPGAVGRPGRAAHRRASLISGGGPAGHPRPTDLGG